MGLPVVTVAAGGLPIVESTNGFGTPVTEATNGRGVAVTKVIAPKPGLPVIFVTVGGGSGGTSAEASAFLARTSGLDATHVNACGSLIDGLVADGIWSMLDMLHVYATQNTATAQLNLVSASYPATLNGSPTFTADRGFTGVNGSTSVYINTNFNPSTASSPKFVQNSAHISAWCVANVGSSGNGFIGLESPGAAQGTAIYPWLATTNVTRIQVNSDWASTAVDAASSSTQGHFVGNRSGSTALQSYRNGSSIATSVSDTSKPVINIGGMYMLNLNFNGAALGGHPGQLAMASIGGSLTPTEITNFYTRLRTYMTAVGVP